MWHAYGVSEEEMSASGNFSYFLSDDDEELRGKKKEEDKRKNEVDEFDRWVLCVYEDED